jgi:hypothetical protein
MYCCIGNAKVSISKLFRALYASIAAASLVALHNSQAVISSQLMLDGSTVIPQRQGRAKRVSQRECVFCEEPQNHTFHGKRILELSCGDVCHEACLYESLMDSVPKFCPLCNESLRLNKKSGLQTSDLGRHSRYYVFILISAKSWLTTGQSDS